MSEITSIHCKLVLAFLIGLVDRLLALRTWIALLVQGKLVRVLLAYHLRIGSAVQVWYAIRVDPWKQRVITRGESYYDVHVLTGMLTNRRATSMSSTNAFKLSAAHARMNGTQLFYPVAPPTSPFSPFTQRKRLETNGDNFQPPALIVTQISPTGWQLSLLVPTTRHVPLVTGETSTESLVLASILLTS